MNDFLSRFRSLLNTQGRGIAFLALLLLGAMLPQLHVFSPLIQYLLMVMLFFSFLDTKFSPTTFQKSIFGVLLANIAIAFIVYIVLLQFNRSLALAAFMTACAPTAIAAPVITGFVKGKVEYVVSAALLTNIASAVIVPLVLPSLLGADIQISIPEVLLPVLIVMFVPLLLAQLAARLPPKAQDFIRKGKPISFPIWLANLLIIGGALLITPAHATVIRLSLSKPGSVPRQESITAGIGFLIDHEETFIIWNAPYLAAAGAASTTRTRSLSLRKPAPLATRRSSGFRPPRIST